jgi:hypothetical protein
MTEQESNSDKTHASRIRHYADILNPLFGMINLMTFDRMFEWACAMVRVAGISDTGWDSYIESIALLENLTHLMSMELASDKFSNPANTQARLAVIAYSHMIEMSVPYDVLANLLRIRLGMKYAMAPFAHLNKIRTEKNNGVKVKKIKPA